MQKKKGEKEMYDYSTYYSTAGVSSADIAAASGILGFIATYSVVILIIGIVSLIGMWKVFTKAGEAGWKCLIPIYNMVILFKIAGISPWFVLGYLATIIPVVGYLVAIGITIYAMINLAKSFGKSGGFAVGLILLEPIFICILGFGSAEYQGKVEA